MNYQTIAAKIKNIPINIKPFRVIIGDLLLAVLAIAWLTEHLDKMDAQAQIFFATFFIGLVLYFKHKD